MFVHWYKLVGCIILILMSNINFSGVYAVQQLTLSWKFWLPRRVAVEDHFSGQVYIEWNLFQTKRHIWRLQTHFKNPLKARRAIIVLIGLCIRALMWHIFYNEVNFIKDGGPQCIICCRSSATIFMYPLSWMKERAKGRGMCNDNYSTRMAYTMQLTKQSSPYWEEFHPVDSAFKYIAAV